MKSAAKLFKVIPVSQFLLIAHHSTALNKFIMNTEAGRRFGAAVDVCTTVSDPEITSDLRDRTGFTSGNASNPAF